MNYHKKILQTNGDCIPTVRTVASCRFLREKTRVIDPSCGELLRFRQHCK